MYEPQNPPRRRALWPVFAAPALVVLGALAWSGFWYYASGKIHEQFDLWRDREAKSGRVYNCGTLDVGGYPFRFEVTCDDARIALRGQAADQPLGDAHVEKILAVAQVYQPQLTIAEFTGPLTIADHGQPPAWAANWANAEASVYGLATSPQRASLVLEAPSLDRVSGTAQLTYARAKHFELHGRLAEGSVSDHPVIDIALDLAQGSAAEAHPIAAEPFDLIAQGQIRGLRDFRPKPWPERFREIQASGGKLEIVKSRIQQGDLIAIAAGSLSITASGYLDGQLNMTVAGLSKIVPALGLDKLAAGESVPQGTLDKIAPGVKSSDVDNVMGALDRLVPGLGGLVRKQAPAVIAAGIANLGEKTVLEGKAAQSFPLRFVDGAVFIGPLRFAQTPALF